MSHNETAVRAPTPPRGWSSRRRWGAWRRGPQRCTQTRRWSLSAGRSSEVLRDRCLELVNRGPICGEVAEVLILGADITPQRVEIVRQARGTLLILNRDDLERPLGALQQPPARTARAFHALHQGLGG